MVGLIALLFFATLAIAVYKKKKYLLWCSVVVILGLLLMVLSHIMYMQILTNVNFTFGIDYKIDDFFTKCVNLSLSDLRLISLLGEVMLLTLFMLITGGLLKKRVLFYIFSVICICVYLYFSLPNVMFEIYININSNVEHIALRTQYIFNLMQNIRRIIIAYFAVIPYLVCFYKYNKTILVFRKIDILNMATYIIAVELMLFLCIVLNIVNNFCKASYEIFGMSNIPDVYLITSYKLVMLAFSFILIFIIVAKSNLSRKYYTKFNVKNIYDISGLDITLKMVLHTYKNIFFMIRQLSDTDMYDANLDEHSKTQFSKINSLSENALYSITRQVKMLSSIENEVEKFEINNCIEQALEHLDDAEREIIQISYKTEENIVNSDVYYLSEAIYNITRNAVEAVRKVKEPTVNIDVLFEDGWFLIEISDNGEGIEKHKIKDIFKPLVSFKNGRDNWGIGLYYSHKIIETLSGYLYVQSEEHKYTKFQIYVPKNI